MDELSHEEKIEKLWGSLQECKSSEASLRLLIEVTEQKVMQQEEIMIKQQKTVETLSEEIRRLGKELNAARVEAMESVRKYIEETSGEWR
jgi:phage shock protein A